MSYRKKTVFLVDVTRVTLDTDYQYNLTTTLMKFWLFVEHIFVDVLNQNGKKCDSHFLRVSVHGKYLERIEGCSLYRGHSRFIWEDIMSTSEGIQYIGECSVHRGIS